MVRTSVMTEGSATGIAWAMVALRARMEMMEVNWTMIADSIGDRRDVLTGDLSWKES
jgi:hypothetical protein